MQLTGSHTGIMFKRYSKCVIKRRLQKILHPGMTMQCMICNDDDDDDGNGGDYDNDHGRDDGDINHDENDD